MVNVVIKLLKFTSATSVRERMAGNAIENKAKDITDQLLYLKNS